MITNIQAIIFSLKLSSKTHFIASTLTLFSIELRADVSATAIGVTCQVLVEL